MAGSNCNYGRNNKRVGNSSSSKPLSPPGIAKKGGDGMGASGTRGTKVAVSKKPMSKGMKGGAVKGVGSY